MPKIVIFSYSYSLAFDAPVRGVGGGGGGFPSEYCHPVW